MIQLAIMTTTLIRHLLEICIALLFRAFVAQCGLLFFFLLKNTQEVINSIFIERILSVVVVGGQLI